MQAHEYETMYRVEDHHWWYRSLHALMLKTLIALRGAREEVCLLDAGCGTGRFMELAEDHAFTVHGFDLSSEALHWCRRRGAPRLAQASILEMPFADESFDAVVSMDVVSCLPPDQARPAYAELGRVLRCGGHLLLNMPAFPWLLSTHDTAVHTVHRTTVRRLREDLAWAGLRPMQLSYRNFTLFPLAASIRLFKKITEKQGDNARSDLSVPALWMNRIFEGILSAEHAVLRRGGGLPFGLSVFAVAEKISPRL